MCQNSKAIIADEENFGESGNNNKPVANAKNLKRHQQPPLPAPEEPPSPEGLSLSLDKARLTPIAGMRRVQMRDKEYLANLYLNIFIPDPEKYAYMTPLGFVWEKKNSKGETYKVDAKYLEPKNKVALTEAKLIKIIDEKEKGRYSVEEKGKKKRVKVARAIAAKQTNPSGKARAIGLDIDEGGVEAVQKVVRVASHEGLCAFGVVSKGSKHDGGHVWALCADWYDAEILHALGVRISELANVDCEVYPTDKRLRLPCMPHLRTLGCDVRKGKLFHAITLDGQVIAFEGRKWQGIAQLLASIELNDQDAIVTAYDKCAKKENQKEKAKEKGQKKDTRRRKNRSKELIRIDNDFDVIGWYNDNYDIDDHFNVNTSKNKVNCPFHEDKTPSASIRWNEQKGCHTLLCFSSNCPEHGRIFDAFEAYCYDNKLYKKEAVKAIAEEHNLGEKPKARLKKQKKAERTIAQQNAELVQGRSRIRDAIYGAQMGMANIVDATCGTGKSTIAREFVLDQHVNSEDEICILLQTKEMTHIWHDKLKELGVNVCIFESKQNLCTCHDHRIMVAANKQGWMLPFCKPTCAWTLQLADLKASEGVVWLFRHNHLTIRGGQFIQKFDHIILDESPFNALVGEQYATGFELEKLIDRMERAKAEDEPALPIVRTLWQIHEEWKWEEWDKRYSTRKGLMLIEQLKARLGDDALDIVRQARLKHRGKPLVENPKAIIDPKTQLPRTFLASLLEAVEHDLERPEWPRLCYGRIGGDGFITGFKWYYRHEALARVGMLGKTIINLDATSQALVDERLWSPLPINRTLIKVGAAPSSKIVQVKNMAHYRQALNDDRNLPPTARRIADVINKVSEAFGVPDLVPEFLIAYKANKAYLAELLFIPDNGTNLLHYGAQRGKDDVKDAQCGLIVGSPTVPHDALQRLFYLLWDGEQMPLRHWSTGDIWIKQKDGSYRAADERLQAINVYKTKFELVQAIHRIRLVLVINGVKIVIVVSPWDLAGWGIKPDLIIHQELHANANESFVAYDLYRQRAKRRLYEGTLTPTSNLTNTPSPPSTARLT